MEGYVAAVTVACSIAVALNAVLQRAGSWSPRTKMVVQRFIPFPAVGGWASVQRTRSKVGPELGVVRGCLFLLSSHGKHAERSPHAKPRAPRGHNGGGRYREGGGHVCSGCQEGCEGDGHNPGHPASTHPAHPTRNHGRAGEVRAPLSLVKCSPVR